MIAEKKQNIPIERASTLKMGQQRKKYIYQVGAKKIYIVQIVSQDCNSRFGTQYKLRTRSMNLDKATSYWNYKFLTLWWHIFSSKKSSQLSLEHGPVQEVYTDPEEFPCSFMVSSKSIIKHELCTSTTWLRVVSMHKHIAYCSAYFKYLSTY